MDSIVIEDLKIYANHGVYEFEKENGQNFYISAKLNLDIQKAAISDDLADTVNYALVSEKIAAFVKEKSLDLIETLADGIAVMLLDNYEMVESVDVTVKKPEAPINMEFGNVYVMVSRKKHKAYIAYGSNLGDSESYIKAAKDMLSKNKYCKLLNESSLYKTTAYGVTDQPDFYNGIFELETYLEAFNLLDLLHDIEKACKRVRKEHWGPRTIDLDIILYDDLVLDTKELTIPHSDMANRDFVLEPLSEIAGYLRHPLTKMTISQMASKVKEKHII